MAKKVDTSSCRKAIGIWIRVSTEDQAKGESPEHHERRARYYAEAKDWEVREVYRLEAVSGKAVMEHPECKRMLADVRRGHISGLIFSKLARLARNTKELLEFADIFRGLGADLISLQESIDTSTPAGRLFYTMIAAMAQWEREEIADRVSASVVVRAKLGKPLNGKICFGYQWQGNKIVPHPDEAPVRKLIYELYLQLRRKKAVATVLNERGYRTRDGSLFSDTSVEYLLRDPTAKGMHRANYTRRLSEAGKQRVLKPDKDWVWTKVEPIVSEELWEQCNRLLSERRAKWKHLGKLPKSVFAGVTYCTCGKKMYVRTNTPKYVCTTCWNKIAIVDLEAIYLEQLKGFFLSPSELAEHLTHADRALQEKRQMLDALGGEQQKLQQEIDRVYRLYVEGQLEGEGFARFFRPLEERQRQLAEEVPRLQAEVDLMKIDHLSADHVLTEAKDLHDRWRSLNQEEKQRVVENITEKIVVGRDEINITLCALPPPEELVKWQHML